MSSDNGSVWLNTKLDAAEAADFEAVQAYHGIKTRSDVIRFLIRAEARRIASPAPSVLEIVGAYNTGHVTAEEALQAIGGHRDHLS